MPKRKIPAPFPAPTSGLPGLLELDRFSAVTLEKWTEASRDIDQLSASLFFETEPERRRYREEMLGALRSAPATALEFFPYAGAPSRAPWSQCTVPRSRHASWLLVEVAVLILAWVKMSFCVHATCLTKGAGRFAGKMSETLIRF